MQGLQVQSEWQQPGIGHDEQGIDTGDSSQPPASGMHGKAKDAMVIVATIAMPITARIVLLACFMQSLLLRIIAVMPIFLQVTLS